jgi:hypothetical protein
MKNSINLRNVSYIVGVWPAFKVASLVQQWPTVAAVAIGIMAMAAWVAFIHWASR